MRRFVEEAFTASLIGAGVLMAAGPVAAQCGTDTGTDTEVVNADIAVATTWTPGKTYRIEAIVHVQTGATLTIEAGTVVASIPGGALIVPRGAQIHVLGTTECPVIMTSTADRATWTAGDPTTGNWRQGAQEWGNLTIMGQGFISENAAGLGNTPTPSATNEGLMEGLTAGSTDSFYGGGNDDDDSGTIEFLSLRFGGQTTAQPTVELNGLSLGAVGRETDIQYVEIMNNIDDGIEIWGGAVNVKNFSIWNIGDDSFDVDQGWRGKAQFGLVVQGFSLSGGTQGAGIGDNIFETDGAEDCWYQPWTTASIHNVTVIGQPVTGAGDHGAAYRDNARIQYRNSIFMDLGDKLVQFDNVDGDGATGYGCLAVPGDTTTATHSWAATWTTAFNATPAYPPSDPSATIDPTVTLADLYQAQSDGNLNDIRNSIFYRNTVGTDATTAGTGTTGDPAYAEALARGVFNPINNNLIIPGNFTNTTVAPIQSLVRNATPETALNMLRVLTVDPRPANQALTSTAFAPEDGFFSAADYVGGFKPGDVAAGAENQTWLYGWSASWAYGLVDDPATLRGYVPTCFGDGSAVPCGCNNLGGPGEGCAHGLSNGVGATLSATGNASISNDTLVLVGKEISNQPGLFFQGNNSIGAGNGSTFGDGIRCCGGGVIRLQIIDPPGTAVEHIAGVTSVDISDVGPNGTSLTAGQTKCYQYWYRTPGVWSACASNFNFSNSVLITWQP